MFFYDRLYAGRNKLPLIISGRTYKSWHFDARAIRWSCRAINTVI